MTTTSTETLAQAHRQQIRRSDSERLIQFQVREARARVRTYAMDQALFYLSWPTMGTATPMERCKRVTAILEAVVKHDKGVGADDVSTRAGMRISQAIEDAAHAAEAEYADWHAFVDSEAAETAETWQLENLARLRDRLGPLPLALYTDMLAALRTAQRVTP